MTKPWQRDLIEISTPFEHATSTFSGTENGECDFFDSKKLILNFADATPPLHIILMSFWKFIRDMAIIKWMAGIFKKCTAVPAHRPLADEPPTRPADHSPFSRPYRDHPYHDRHDFADNIDQDDDFGYNDVNDDLDYDDNDGYDDDDF